MTIIPILKQKIGKQFGGHEEFNQMGLNFA